MTQDAERAAVVRAWLDGAAPGLGAALGDSGAAVGLASASCGEMDDLAARESLPATCSAIVVRLTRGETEGPIVLLLPPAAARRCAWAGADDAAEKCGADGPLSDAERAALESRASAFKTALEDALGAALDGASAGDGATVHLADSEWSADDPLVQGTWVSVELELELEGVAAAPAWLLVSTIVIERVVPAILAAEPEGSAAAPEVSGSEASGDRPDGDLIAFTASADLRSRLADSLGAARECSSLDELIAAWSRDDVAGAVVEVPPGSEYMLSTLRGLKEFPGCEDRPVVILLGEPTTWNVIRCGRLGLFDVLPTDCGGDELLERISHPSGA